MDRTSGNVGSSGDLNNPNLGETGGRGVVNLGPGEHLDRFNRRVNKDGMIYDNDTQSWIDPKFLDASGSVITTDKTSQR